MFLHPLTPSPSPPHHTHTHTHTHTHSRMVQVVVASLPCSPHHQQPWCQQDTDLQVRGMVEFSLTWKQFEATQAVQTHAVCLVTLQLPHYMWAWNGKRFSSWQLHNFLKLSRREPFIISCLQEQPRSLCMHVDSCVWIFEFQIDQWKKREQLHHYVNDVMVVFLSLLNLKFVRLSISLQNGQF